LFRLRRADGPRLSIPTAPTIPRFGFSHVLRIVGRDHLRVTLALAMVACGDMHVFRLVFAPMVVVVGCMGFFNPDAMAGVLTDIRTVRQHGKIDRWRLFGSKP
jgi:hypothetical protein